MRIAKYLASCGVASRRACERLVQEGLVRCDGLEVKDCSFRVQGEGVTVAGRVVRALKPRMFLYHKRPGLIVSRKDDRKSIFDDLSELDKRCRLVSVGRLDLFSEGLMILTNRGYMAHAWETSSLPRRYCVVGEGEGWERVEKPFRHYKPLKLLSQKRREGVWEVRVELREGKNREIRNIWAHHGWRVYRLVREAYGPFTFEMLKGNKCVEVEAILPEAVMKEPA